MLGIGSWTFFRSVFEVSSRYELAEAVFLFLLHHPLRDPPYSEISSKAAGIYGIRSEKCSCFI